MLHWELQSNFLYFTSENNIIPIFEHGHPLHDCCDYIYSRTLVENIMENMYWNRLQYLQNILGQNTDFFVFNKQQINMTTLGAFYDEFNKMKIHVNKMLFFTQNCNQHFTIQ